MNCLIHTILSESRLNKEVNAHHHVHEVLSTQREMVIRLILVSKYNYEINRMHFIRYFLLNKFPSHNHTGTLYITT